MLKIFFSSSQSAAAKAPQVKGEDEADEQDWNEAASQETEEDSEAGDGAAEEAELDSTFSSDKPPSLRM